MKRNKIILIISTILLLCYTFYCIYSIVDTISFKKTAVQVNARVENINVILDTQMTTVSFKYKGYTCGGEIKTFSPYLKEGDSIKVWIDPDNFQDIRYSTKFEGIIFHLVSFSIIPYLCVIWYIFKNRNKISNEQKEIV